jgi:hypothetical protein
MPQDALYGVVALGITQLVVLLGVTSLLSLSNQGAGHSMLWRVSGDGRLQDVWLRARMSQIKRCWQRRERSLNISFPYSGLAFLFGHRPGAGF